MIPKKSRFKFKDECGATVFKKNSVNFVNFVNLE